MPRSTCWQPTSPPLSLGPDERGSADPCARTLAARGLLLAIAAYQVLFSQLFIGSCRFEPSCSHYAAEAVQTHGAWRGTVLVIARLIRCHPFCAGGIDPVPAARMPIVRNLQ